MNKPIVAVTVTLPDGSTRGYDAANTEELDLPADVQIRGLLKGIRGILQTPAGESILDSAYQAARRARMWLEEHKAGSEVPEADKQMICLSLALTALLRPGLAYYNGDVAERVDPDKGRELFERFKVGNADMLPMISLQDNERRFLRTAIRIVELQGLIVDTEDQELVLKYEAEESERMAEFNAFKEHIEVQALADRLHV